MPGQAQPLRHQPTLRIADGSGIIHDVLQHAGIGGAVDGERHLVAEGDDGVAEQFFGDRVVHGRSAYKDIRGNAKSGHAGAAPSEGDAAVITVYGLALSGNCWKVAQILRSTGRAFRWVEIDSNKGETRTPEFLARKPGGQDPRGRAR